MSGTTKQATEAILRKLCEKHWINYEVLGSKPYRKGAKIICKSTGKTIQVFESNNDMYLTMVESITKKNGWYPGKDITLTLDFNIKEDKVKVKEKKEQTERVIYNNARQARDLRIEADKIFNYINIDPLDECWLNKLNKILKDRRVY